jgi:hypothetical protein
LRLAPPHRRVTWNKPIGKGTSCSPPTLKRHFFPPLDLFEMPLSPFGGKRVGGGTGTSGREREGKGELFNLSNKA